MKKLEIGPGTAPLSGYDSIDCYKHHNPTYLIDITKDQMWGIPPETYDEVLAIHVLEHVALNRVGLVFRNVFRILKTGGVFRVHVPNGPVIINAYIKFPEQRDTVQTCIYGCEAQEDTKYDVAHKVLYDSGLLMKQFHSANFTDVKDVTKDPFYMDRHDPYWSWMDPDNNFSLKVMGKKS